MGMGSFEKLRRRRARKCKISVKSEKSREIEKCRNGEFLKFTERRKRIFEISVKNEKSREI